MGNDWGPVTSHRGRSRWRTWTVAVWTVLGIYWFEFRMWAGLLPWEYILLGIAFAAFLLIAF